MSAVIVLSAALGCADSEPEAPAIAFSVDSVRANRALNSVYFYFRIINRTSDTVRVQDACGGRVRPDITNAETGTVIAAYGPGSCMIAGAPFIMMTPGETVTDEGFVSPVPGARYAPEIRVFVPYTSERANVVRASAFLNP